MKKKLLIIFGVFLTGFLATTDTYAAHVIDFYEPSPAYRGEISTDAQRKGQSWTATATIDYDLSSVKVYLGRDGEAGGTAVMEIFAVDGSGLATGTALGTSAATDTTGLADYPNNTLCEFLFGTAVEISKGVQYAFSIKRTSGGKLAVHGIDPGSYGGGSYITSADSGAHWADGDGQLWFQTWGEESSSTPPAGGGGSVDMQFPELLIVVLAVFMICLVLDRGTGFLKKRIEVAFQYRI